jgi:3',5'-cyclic AMP phosphodiesterase CpdA
MKKIIHFSDVHVGYHDCGDRFQGIVRNVIFTKEPASAYVIAVTGDLVESSLGGLNYEEAEIYINRLREAGFTLLLAPGNHDYGTGTLGNKKYVPIFKKLFLGNAEIVYPKLDILDEIAFITLDTMAEELHWYDRLFAQGELGRAQLERLDSALARDDVRQCRYRVVLMHHHPFDPWRWHELKDSDALSEVLMGRRNIDALLYGHNHLGKTRNGKWGIPRCYDAGTTTRKQGMPSLHRVIDLTRDPRWDYDANFHARPPAPDAEPPQPEPTSPKSIP